MYRNALVTTDGLDLAAAALKQVPQVVSADAKVTIVEVIDSIGQVLAKTTPAGFEMGFPNDGQIAEEIVKAQRVNAEQHLSAARDMLVAAGVKDVETLIREGSPGDEIVQAATGLKADLVVMSTHGRSGLRRAVLGSVADHVLRHLDGVPVLLVHPAP